MEVYIYILHSFFILGLQPAHQSRDGGVPEGESYCHHDVREQSVATLQSVAPLQHLLQYNVTIPLTLSFGNSGISSLESDDFLSNEHH